MFSPRMKAVRASFRTELRMYVCSSVSIRDANLWLISYFFKKDVSLYRMEALQAKAQRAIKQECNSRKNVELKHTINIEHTCYIE